MMYYNNKLMRGAHLKLRMKPAVVHMFNILHNADIGWEGKAIFACLHVRMYPDKASVSEIIW